MNRVQQRFWIFAGLAFIAGTALRLWFIRNYPLIAGDSLVYGDIAKNWIQHGIYGFTESASQGTARIRPTLIRLPGYPLFLAICFQCFGMANYHAVLYIQAVADLVTCCFVGALAHLLFGPRAALIALWAAMLCPFTASYVAEPLTETLVLTTIAITLYALMRWQIGGCGYNLWLWLVTATIAASTLLRPEQILFAAAVLVAMLCLSIRSRSGESVLTSSRPILIAVFLVTMPFIPWTIRNAHTFHVFQPFAPRYANDPGEPASPGFGRWYRTWAIDFIDTENVYWNYSGSPIYVSDLPSRAFAMDSTSATQSMRLRTTQLLADYNATTQFTTNVSPSIDARFAALAALRIRAHRILYYFALPIARVADMTLRPRTETIPISLDWWHWRAHLGQSLFAAFYAVLNFAYLAFGIAGLLAWRRHGWRAYAILNYPREHSRELALVMCASLVLRAALLLTIDNSEPRYTLEFFPVLFVWIAALFAQWPASDTATERSGR